MNNIERRIQALERFHRWQRLSYVIRMRNGESAQLALARASGEGVALAPFVIAAPDVCRSSEEWQQSARLGTL